MGSRRFGLGGILHSSALRKCVKKPKGKSKSPPLRRPLAVVTGASSGIGYELAKQFAVQGYDLIICDEENGVQRSAQQLSKLGTQVEHHQLKLASRKGVEAFHKHVQADGRPVSAVAINCGVGVGGEFTHGNTLETELHLVELNIVATVHLSRLLLADMRSKGKGRLLLTSSLVVTDPGPFQAVYSATRAFLHSYTLALREELKGSEVSVSSLLPGDTDANFFPRTGAVARQGFEALMKGKDQVVDGTFLGRVLGALAGALPRGVASLLQKLQLGAGSAFSH